MRYRLDVLEEVYKEVEVAGEYYYSQRPGLEKELFADFERTLNRISKTPEGFQKQVKNLRHALLDTFPYLIVFEFTIEAIVVYRFINVRRHPGKRHAKRKK